MSLDINDLTVDPQAFEREHLLDEWQWLVKADDLPVLLTAAGDVFTQNAAKEVWVLDTCEGKYEKVTDDGATFQESLTDVDFLMKYFHAKLIVDCRKKGVKLEAGQCYSYIHPLALGGDDVISNIKALAIDEHLNQTGKVHKQVAELPEGSKLTDIKIDLGK